MRKQKIVEVTAEGRDKGKHFLITEMPAMQAEAWATRALLALGRSGADVGDIEPGTGMAGIAVIGLRALLRVSYEDARPLLDEMMTCVRVVPDPRNQGFSRPIVSGMGEDDIEEIATIVQLRAEIFELHTDFSISDAVSRSLASLVPSETSETSPTFPR